MKPDDPLLPGAAEAAASVRFQPAAEDAHVCPACYHPPHVGMCELCLCFKAVPARADAQRECKYGDPTCPCQDGDECHYEGDNPMRPYAQAVEDPVEAPGPVGRHRREVPKSSKLQWLRKWARRG